MSMLHIFKRSMSNSTTRNLLRSERSAVKRNTGAFESQLNSATTQHRTKDDRGGMIPNQNAEQTLQSSNNNLAAGRLKRDSMQSTDERAAEVNRIGGRIVRNDERKRSGGSIAVQTSATAMHRKTRTNTDDMVVTNPSNLSIPILTPEFAESSEGKKHINEDEINTENEVQNDNQSSGGVFGKVVVFLAGTSAGLACASFFI